MFAIMDHVGTLEFWDCYGKIMKPIKKAVFPVAGMGTRFLPATKANPKEMLPVVDKPVSYTHLTLPTILLV